jgi:type I restriction-modification system DNA methylase subunit
MKSNMTTRITQQQLESYLWGAATLLRGTIDAGDSKQFIFPLLFYKPYGQNIHRASVRGVEEVGASYLRLDWIDNQQPFLLGSLTESYVSTDKVFCHATAMQI